MNEEVRTLKVYKNSTNHSYKVEVREKGLEKAQLDSEWMEERREEELSEPEEPSYEESAERTEVEETESYTPDELLMQEMDELDCQLYNMKEYDVRTLKACKE
ncbi:hypothetical protein A2U01_0062208 [Trifolium medium]|uniref:Uncharacterized protein n=1 Tax=Trifolium medium TaxID=97028 RepID=A0A392RZC2_9FABA|nr:hypothetical protein [Trifolium medium]